MKQWLDGLKPQERRWVVGVGFIAFLLLNYFFVWPHFGDLNKYDARIDKANQQIETYNKEVRNQATYQRRFNELQADGSSVPPDNQAINFIRTYSGLAIANKVITSQQGNLTTRTNDFSLDQQMGVIVVADETNLVNFLYALGLGDSMIRVRAMSLHPDQGHQNLNASITLVASYQKKLTPRSTAAGAATRTAAAPPAPAVAPPPAAPMATPISPQRTNHMTALTNKVPSFASTNKTGLSIPKRP